MVESSTRWRLRDDVVFVDAYMVDEKKGYSIDKRFPKEIPYPHLMDNIHEKDEAKRDVTLLSNIAAFIARFIVMGVDVEKHLPDIVFSEFGIKTEEEKDEVRKEINAVMAIMQEKGYLIAREKTPKPKEDHSYKEFKVTKKNYPLEAGIHSIGPTIIRGFR